jgi:glycosyltransferase involved in cell wall biosynthesis
VSRDLPLVSIVIPAYNYAGYLDQAIRSVLDQDYPNIELLVLDDGSTDDTRKVLEKYAGLFYQETQENMGQAATINKGWRMSKGEILAYLSADDVLLPGATNASVKHLLANPDVVLTYCDYQLIDVDSKPIRRVKAPEFDYCDMVVKFVCPPGPGAFVRRGAFEKTGFWNGSLRQVPDYEYWLRLGLQGRFLRVPEVLAGFRVHSGSRSFAAVEEQRSEEYIKVVEDYYRHQSIPPEVLAAKNEALSNAHIVAARSHLRSGRYAMGLSRLREGISLYPRSLASFRTFRFIGHGLFNHLRYRNA